MVSLVNFHTNATSKKRWHLWENDLRFALNSTPGWIDAIELRAHLHSLLACLDILKGLNNFRTANGSSQGQNLAGLFQVVST